MKIIRVINNNNVCVINERGMEQIVSGKGIGFNRKIGDVVKESQIQKIYLIADSAVKERLISLLSEIPEGYIKFAGDLVEHIKEVIPQKLNESLLVSLSDHIYFAIKRKRQGIEFTNPLMDSLRTCYSEELNLGYYCLEQIEKRLKIKFIPDEAGFIAMHIINARLETDMSGVYENIKLVNACSEIVMHNFPNIDVQNVTYERFMVHVRFMVNRICENKSLPEILSNDMDFLNHIKNSYECEYRCAEEIIQYILECKHVQLPDDEKMTLCFHIARMVRAN